MSRIENIKIGDLVYNDLLNEWVFIYSITTAEENIDTHEICFNGDWNDGSSIRKEFITHIIPQEELEKYKVSEQELEEREMKK